MYQMMACAENMADRNRWISASVRGHSRPSIASSVAEIINWLGEIPPFLSGFFDPSPVVFVNADVLVDGFSHAAFPLFVL